MNRVISAQRFGKDWRVEAVTPSGERVVLLVRGSLRQALEQDMAELAGYRERVEELRRAIQETMAGLEQQAEEMEQQVEELYEAVPAGNLTLFQ